MVDPKRFWARDDIPEDAGLSAEQIRDCGSRFGVSFPDLYVQLFGVSNGGGVRDAELEFFPLFPSVTPGNFGVVASAEHMAGEDEFAREMIEEELGDPRLVLLIAGEDGHTYHALDFNASGPSGEPRVVWLDFECSDCTVVSPSFDAFVEKLMRADDECAVDMTEARRLPVIARETIDYEYETGIRDRVDQYLCDAGASLVLLVDRSSPEGDELSRVEIAMPLDADSCEISPMRPKPNQTFMLMLHPKDDDGILWTTSRKTSDGRWKNGTSQGVPIYATFEMTDKSRLRELRRELLDGEVPEHVAAGEEWQERVEELSEDEMQATIPHMMLQMMGEMEDLLGDIDPGDVPEELRPGLEQLEQLKEKMMGDLEQRAADTEAPNPEMLDLLKQMMPKPGDFKFDE